MIFNYINVFLLLSVECWHYERWEVVSFFLTLSFLIAISFERIIFPQVVKLDLIPTEIVAGYQIWKYKRKHFDARPKMANTLPALDTIQEGRSRRKVEEAMLRHRCSREYQILRICRVKKKKRHPLSMAHTKSIMLDWKVEIRNPLPFLVVICHTNSAVKMDCMFVFP